MTTCGALKPKILDEKILPRENRVSRRKGDGNRARLRARVWSSLFWIAVLVPLWLR